MLQAHGARSKVSRFQRDKQRLVAHGCLARQRAAVLCVRVRAQERKVYGVWEADGCLCWRERAIGVAGTVSSEAGHHLGKASPGGTGVKMGACALSHSIDTCNKRVAAQRCSSAPRGLSELGIEKEKKKVLKSRFCMKSTSF